MGKSAKIIKEAGIIDSKYDTDTFRLWESYREQAILWRALTLLQIPATLAAIILAIYLHSTRETILNVPPKPLPGLYHAQEIPDSEFIDVATNFVNLIASYQTNLAREQFNRAMRYIQEPMLSRFREDMMGEELKAIENTNRTQLFFIDPIKTDLKRTPQGVIVSMLGERMKLISGKELPAVQTRFEITMNTTPRNELNPYGIMVSNIFVENVKN